MKSTKLIVTAFALIFALALFIPATASAAPPLCGCSYCDANPEQWCTYLGSTNSCSLYLHLNCGGGALAASHKDVFPAESFLASDSCGSDLISDEIDSQEVESSDVTEDAKRTEVDTAVATESDTRREGTLVAGT